MNLSPEEILGNWEKMLGHIETHIESPRKEKLLSFYASYLAQNAIFSKKERLKLAMRLKYP